MSSVSCFGVNSRIIGRKRLLSPLSTQGICRFPALSGFLFAVKCFKRRSKIVTVVNHHKAFSSEVDAGSRQENASKQKARAGSVLEPGGLWKQVVSCELP
jgi:hypothetical protein